MTRPYLQCINCGAPVDKLSYTFVTDSRIIKLTRCKQCDKIADKYIEYDPIIVGIDAILYKREAYRHMFFNASIVTPWRWAVVLVVVCAYVPWSDWKTSFLADDKSHNHAGRNSSSNNSTTTLPSGFVRDTIPIYLLESRFYTLLLLSLFEISAFIVLSAALSYAGTLSSRIFQHRRLSHAHDATFGLWFNALIISSWPSIAEVVSVIWKEPSESGAVTLIFRIFAFLCHSMAFSLVHRRTQFYSACMIAWCYAIVFACKMVISPALLGDYSRCMKSLD